jgi:hypothetical protein
LAEPRFEAFFFVFFAVFAFAMGNLCGHEPPGPRPA